MRCPPSRAHAVPTAPPWRRSSTPPPGSSPRTRCRTPSPGSPTTSRASSTSTRSPSTRSGEEMLVPVFALGAYADEVMADSFPVTEGVTGWVVTNRRTRNVDRADIEPLAAVVEGTENEPESLVSVPLLVGDRFVAALNVYRIGLGKEFSDAEVATVERFATMAALAFDSARQRDTLREQARTDGLTGLLNHRACHETLGEELAGATQAEQPLSVVVLDLDHFKSINDVYGHAEGDKVLKEVAARLRAAVRAGDTVARLGGEEFALILPGVDGDGAAEAAERARAAIAAVQVAGAAADLLRRRRRVPGGRARGRPAARARRRRALPRQALGPRPGAPLRPAARRPALRRRPAGRDRGAARARGRDRARLPAGAGARHGPRRRLRGARPDARRPVPAARPVVQPGAPRRPRAGARGGRAARRARAPAAGRSARSSRSTSARARSSPTRSAPSLPAGPHRHRHRAHRARALLGRPDARPRARRAAGARRADRARRRGQRLRGPAADHPDRARHPQARPLARRRRPRRPAPLRAAGGADLLRLDDPRRGLRRGRRDARGPRRARRHGRHLRPGLGARPPGRAVGRARAAGRGRGDGRGPDRPARAARERRRRHGDARRPDLAAHPRAAAPTTSRSARR